MHRRPEAELLPLDTELERTLRNLKKVRVAKASMMADESQNHLLLVHFFGIFWKFMTHFNAELWNIHQLCVLQVLNEKETIPTRKAENLAKVEMSRHKFDYCDKNLLPFS